MKIVRRLWLLAAMIASAAPAGCGTLAEIAQREQEQAAYLSRDLDDWREMMAADAEYLRRDWQDLQDAWHESWRRAWATEGDFYLGR